MKFFPWLFAASLFASTVLISCNSKPQSSEGETAAATENTQQKEGTQMKVNEMDLAMFKNKVWDYEANSKEFKFKGDKPALVDFYATWCGPCKVTAPILEDLAHEYEGKVDFYKVDVDQQGELAGLFGIRSIPSLLFIPAKGEPSMQVGAHSREDLKKMIDAMLQK